MMDSNGPGSEVFVLDAAGRLHELRLTQNNLEQYGSVALPNEFVPADMTYVSSGGQESLLIAGTESGLGVVINYSLDGRALKTWNFRNICSGIDFAPKTHSAVRRDLGFEGDLPTGFECRRYQIRHAHRRCQ